MTDTPSPDAPSAKPGIPDRLSTNPKSPHYDEALLARGVGIKFDGEEKTNVEEYCVSEGWVRLAVGKKDKVLRWLDNRPVYLKASERFVIESPPQPPPGEPLKIKKKGSGGASPQFK